MVHMPPVKFLCGVDVSFGESIGRGWLVAV